MITSNDRVALDMFNTLAKLRGRLAEFRRVVLSELKPVDVEFGVECNSYETGLVVSAFLDADLGAGCGVVWWLDVTHDGECWRLCPSVTWNGQEELLPLEERTVAHAEELVRALPLALEDLLATLDAVAKSVYAVDGKG